MSGGSPNTFFIKSIVIAAAVIFAVGVVSAYLLSQKGGGAVTREKSISAEEKVSDTTSGPKTFSSSTKDRIARGALTPAKKGNGQTYAGTVLAGTSAPLLDFAQPDYDAALQSGKLIVLYFFANWCPICQEETANALYPAFRELATRDVIGFRVNYNDNQTDSDERSLAQKFGVAYQHTKVFVRNGARILKSPEGWDTARYRKEIQNALQQSP